MLPLSKLNGFKFEDRHLRTGMTTEDFTECCGYFVPVISHTAFPHYDKFYAGHIISEKELLERANAIHTELLHIAENDPEGWDLLVNEKRAKKLASFKLAGVHAYAGYFNHKKYNIPKTHFTNIQGRLTKRHYGRASQINDGLGSYVYARPIEHEGKDVLSNVRMKYRAQPVVVLPPPGFNSVWYWSMMTCLPEGIITRVPQGKCEHPFVAGHELSHLMQIFLSAKLPRDDYYEELDADINSRFLVSPLPKASQFKRAQISARYISMLFTPRNYWFAPALDAIEKKQHIPLYSEVVHSTKLLHRLVRSYANKNCAFSQRRFFWHSWRNEFLKQKPEKGYGLINAMLREGRFKQDPLCQDIAEKIIRGVRYFSPRLIP